jgi:hypothetical protein
MPRPQPLKHFTAEHPDAVLAAAGVAPGDEVRVAVRPHPQPESVAPYRPGGKRG